MPEHWRIAMTLLVVLFLSGSVATYVHRRASWAFALGRTPRRLLAALFAAGLLATTLSRTLSREYAELAGSLGQLGGALVLGILISAALLVPIELVRIVARVFGRMKRGDAGGALEATVELAPAEQPAPARAPVSPARREFLAQAAAGSAISLGMASASYGTWIGRRDYTLETVHIRLPKLPKALEGLTIVQLSDLHVGTFVGDRELAAARELVRSAKADLVVLTGDLVDHDPSYASTLGRFTRSLQGHSRYGVFAIPGNHDYYAGAAAVLSALRAAGTEVLLNRHVRIGDGKQQLVLAGVDDVKGSRYGGPGPQLVQAFDGAPDELARVLLSHNPAFFTNARAHADLTLSGHTHGGQIALFINPAQLVLRHGLVRGHYTVDDSQIYVNRGFGTAGPPVRVGSPPEVTRLVLTA